MSAKSRFGSEGFDCQEQNLIVPTCEAVLDVCSVHTPVAHAQNGLLNSTVSTSESKQQRTEAVFKREVLQITHILKLRGWNKIPLSCSDDIGIKKLSGATTNAVYVVSTPTNHDGFESTPQSDEKCLSRKVLLRIYGAQTEYLINRAAEIHVLGRLAQKNLGPHVLGIFTNGRLEEYFSARPLTIMEMCEPETSVQIAQQLRELHDGLPLNDKELDAGPFIWCIWDKWVERCEEVCTVLDAEILKSDRTADEGRGNSWRERGLVCGTEWVVFRRTVERYREFLHENYGGLGGSRTNLVFAHNDVKYDNVLRLEPGEESSLPQRSSPLVLIDFEYSGANFRGFDFANHFTEWCYDYNHEKDPTAFREKLYPTVEEQRRFVRAYVEHTHAMSTPDRGDGSPESDSQHEKIEGERERWIEREIVRLLAETKLWRAATSVLWVAWAIVQADLDRELAQPIFHNGNESEMAVPRGQREHLEEPTDLRPKSHADPNNQSSHMAVPAARLDEVLPNSDVVKKTIDGEPTEEEEGAFDYLGCAQDRVLVFWGDIVSLGIVAASELPGKLRKRIKTCDDRCSELEMI